MKKVLEQRREERAQHEADEIGCDYPPRTDSKGFRVYDLALRDAASAGARTRSQAGRSTDSPASTVRPPQPRISTTLTIVGTGVFRVSHYYQRILKVYPR